VTGATSYVDLRTVDGDTLSSFRDAAQRRGLLEADDTIDESLNEDALYQMPSALQRLFATILVYCEPNDVAQLWQSTLMQCQRTITIVLKAKPMCNRWS
jgi:ATP-dependent DNA helicase PIF1